MSANEQRTASPPAQRIAAEEKRQALDDKLVAEEAKIAADRVRDTFLRARSSDAGPKGEAFQQDLMRATALAEAGNTPVPAGRPSCSARYGKPTGALVTCAKQLAGDARQVGRQYAATALDGAIAIHVWRGPR